MPSQGQGFVCCDKTSLSRSFLEASGEGRSLFVDHNRERVIPLQSRDQALEAQAQVVLPRLEVKPEPGQASTHISVGELEFPLPLKDGDLVTKSSIG